MSTAAQTPLTSRRRATWIDPRIWSGLVRAYALFLALATVSEYNKLWSLVFAENLMSTADHVFGTFAIDATSIALLVLPWLVGQLVIVLWVILSVRPRAPESSDPSVSLAIETMQAAGFKPSGFRAPRLLVGAVAQPVVISVVGKPFLILPRQGLAYFRHRLGAQASAAFRSVIAHEIAHLTTWDDLLFFPWFSYFIGASVCCLAGLFMAWNGHLLFSLVLSHAVLTGALGLLGLYVLRRREAYCDAYSVMLVGNESPIRLALSSLANESRGRQLWQGTHFDARRRLALLDQRGRSFLELSRADFGIATFIYFYSNTKVISSLSIGRTLIHEVFSLSDFVIQLLLLLLLLMMVAGLAVAREGKRLRFRELAVPAAICIVTGQSYDALQRGFDNTIGIVVSIVLVLSYVLIGTPLFVAAVRVLYSWCVALLYRPETDTASRMFVNLVRLVAALTVIDKLFNIGTGWWASSAFSDPLTIIESQLAESLLEKAKPVIPIFAFLILVFLLQGSLIVSLWVWARLRCSAAVRLRCPACRAPVDARVLEKPLLQNCPFCGEVMRGDFLIRFDAESETA